MTEPRETGDPIPAVSALNLGGQTVPLTNQAGRALVVFFYPKADTPGCTNEAKDFSALRDAFVAAGADVVGVSRDTAAKQQKFADKHALTVDLLSDSDGSVTEAFGVWVEKSLYGRQYMGIERATFLFGADGRLVQAWRKVKVKGHAAAVLEAARAL